MKLIYASDVDQLNIQLNDTPSTKSAEVAPGVVFDFDADGRVVAIDIEYASKLADLSTLALLGLTPSHLTVSESPTDTAA